MRTRHLRLLALAGLVSAFALAGCGDDASGPAGAGPVPVRILLRTDSDSGLAFLAGGDTVISPVSLLVPADRSLRVTVIDGQRFDLSPDVEGADTRYLFAGWADTNLPAERHLPPGDRRDTLIALFIRQVKVEVSIHSGSTLVPVDTSWRAVGSRLDLHPPPYEGHLFRGWRVNGAAAPSGPSLQLEVAVPLSIRAEFLAAETLSLQSDWSAGFPFRIGDSSAITPFTRIYPHGESITISFPEVSWMDASPFVAGEDLALRGLFWDRQPGEAVGSRTVLMDSTLRLFIPTRRTYKVVVRPLPDDSSGECSAVPGRNPRLPAGEPTPSRTYWHPDNALLHLSARPRAGFVFSHWALNGDTLSQADSLEFRVNWPASLDAVFVPRYALLVRTAPDSSLSVRVGEAEGPAPWSEDFSQARRLQVGVPALQEKDLYELPGPDMRFHFRRWREDSLTANPRVVAVESPRILTAEFDVSCKVVLIDSLSAARDSSEQWVALDSEAVLTARPDARYKVAYWDINGAREEGGDTLRIRVGMPILAMPQYVLADLDAQISEVYAQWRSVLGTQGGEMADRLLAAHSGPCPSYSSGAEVLETGRSMRAALLAATGVDLKRRARSHEIQKRYQGPGYTLEVATLEVFPGLMLPLNVYVPDGKAPHTCPLIVTPPGFGQGASSETVQIRAANLALRGMVVVVPEGFNSNGARAALQGDNNYLLYGRSLIGLPSSNSVFLQELVSAITWAAETYPQVDPGRIGGTGYSYGGGMTVELAQLDERVRTISVPATGFGAPCGDLALHPDLFVEYEEGAGFVWSPPPESPVLPPNAEVAMLYPRHLQTLSGSKDPGAPPSLMGQVMSLAGDWYGLGGYRDRLSYATDDGDHNFDQPRREATYAWLASSLPLDSARSPSERPAPLFPENALEPNIDGGRSLVQELDARVDAESAARFRAFQPAGDYAARVRRGMDELFGSRVPGSPKASTAWRKSIRNGLSVEALRVEDGGLAYPVFVIKNPGAPDPVPVLYLPLKGTLADSSVLATLVAVHRTVYSIDYMGIGELRSGSVMLHTLARHFMFNDPSLARIIVDGLRDFLSTLDRPVRLRGEGWASSFFAAALRYLEPARTVSLETSGVPADELDNLRSGNKTPDLLLWGGLFGKVSVTEIEAACLLRP